MKFPFMFIRMIIWSALALITAPALAGWQLMDPAPPVSNLNDIWGTSDHNIFAVGEGGVILHYDGDTWTQMDSGTAETLTAVWGTSGNEVFAVGSGLILRYDGSTWSEMASGLSGWYTDIWGSSGDNVYAVGWQGIINHYDGSQWSDISVTSTYYEGIWGSSKNNIFIIGNDANAGVVRYYNGSFWSTIDFGVTYQGFKKIWGSSGNNIFIVGSSGTVLHFDGSGWSEMNSGTSETLNGVWGSSGDNVFAVGTFGTILHYDGSKWMQMDSGTTEFLDAVWGEADSHWYAVGHGSVMLQLIPFNISPASVEISEPDGSTTFTISLPMPPTADVQVELYSSNVTECTVSPQTAVLNSSNWDTGVTVTVTAEPDLFPDGTQEAHIVLDRTVSDDGRFHDIDPSDVAVTILDDSQGPAIFSISHTYGVSGNDVSPLFMVIEGQNLVEGIDITVTREDGTQLPADQVNLFPFGTTMNGTVAAPDEATSYTFTISDTEGTISRTYENAVSFSSQEDINAQKRNKAILVAAGEEMEGNDLWLSTKKIVNKAYRTLLRQGYFDDYDNPNIYLLSPEAVKDPPPANVDKDATLADLENTIVGLADSSPSTDNLLIFLTGPTVNGELAFSDGTLSPSVLDGWLDTLQKSISGSVIVIYDTNDSGSVLSDLKPPSGKKRTVISSTSPGERAWFLDDGEVSFSYKLWENIALNPNLIDSFITANDFISPLQTPLIDTNGDGISDTPDVNQDNHFQSRNSFVDTNPPVIGSLSANPQQLSGGKTDSVIYIPLSSVQSDNGIFNIRARVINPIVSTTNLEEPVLYVPNFKLLNLYNIDWRHHYQRFNLHGPYLVFVYATDKQNVESNSEIVLVEQIEGDVIDGDTDADGRVTLKDAILVLKFLSGMAVSPLAGADVSGEGKIDLSEAAFILQTVSKIR